MNAADLLWAAAVAATLSGMVCYEVGRARGFRKGYDAATSTLESVGGTLRKFETGGER